MEIKSKFEILYLEEAVNFLESLDEKVRAKIQYNILKSQRENDIELFKKLNDNIWEFRTKYNGMSY